ncbi:MAG: class I SAM-dependent methyltransferase, partial [Pseudomonadota bacterium]
MSEPDPDKALLERAYSLETESETRALYRDWAASYDQTMLSGLKYLTPAKTAAMLEREVEDRNALVLDVGCGTGLAGENLAALGFSTIDGMDYCAEMLDTARAKQHGGKPVYQRLIEADLTLHLPVADQTYDHMICTGTFTHAHVGAEALRE